MPVSTNSHQSTTPLTLTPLSTENSPASTESSSLTPSLSHMQLGRCRGHPCKIPKEPTYDDFPINGTAEDKKKWFHRKIQKIGDTINSHQVTELNIVELKMIGQLSTLMKRN